MCFTIGRFRLYNQSCQCLICCNYNVTHWDLFFGLYSLPLCFLNHNISRDGSSLVLRWNLLCWVWSIELASIQKQIPVIQHCCQRHLEKNNLIHFCTLQIVGLSIAPIDLLWVNVIYQMMQQHTNWWTGQYLDLIILLYFTVNLDKFYISVNQPWDRLIVGHHVCFLLADLLTSWVIFGFNLCITSDAQSGSTCVVLLYC
jgi:hypothetical protein